MPHSPKPPKKAHPATKRNVRKLKTFTAKRRAANANNPRTPVTRARRAKTRKSTARKQATKQASAVSRPAKKSPRGRASRTKPISDLTEAIRLRHTRSSLTRLVQTPDLRGRKRSIRGSLLSQRASQEVKPPSRVATSQGRGQQAWEQDSPKTTEHSGCDGGGQQSKVNNPPVNVSSEETVEEEHQEQLVYETAALEVEEKVEVSEDKTQSENSPLPTEATQKPSTGDESGDLFVKEHNSATEVDSVCTLDTSGPTEPSLPPPCDVAPQSTVEDSSQKDVSAVSDVYEIPKESPALQEAPDVGQSEDREPDSTVDVKTKDEDYSDELSIKNEGALSLLSLSTSIYGGSPSGLEAGPQTIAFFDSKVSNSTDSTQFSFETESEAGSLELPLEHRASVSSPLLETDIQQRLLKAQERKEIKKRSRCGACGPCLLKVSCGQCSCCLNRKTGHQICKLRKCVELKKRALQTTAGEVGHLTTL